MYHLCMKKGIMKILVGQFNKKMIDEIKTPKQENKIIYGCKSEDLRKWYRENIDDIKTLEYKSREYKTAKEKISLLAFIPLDRMEREIKSFRKWSVK